MKLYDLLFLKGGFRDKDFVKTTHLEEAHILRSRNSGNDKQTELLTFNLGKVLEGDQKENYELKSEDVIIIRENPGSKDINTVTIEGEVVLPGIYPLASIKVEGEVHYPIVLAFSEKKNSLQHYIDSAGGRTDKAVLNEVLVTYPNGTHAKYSNPRDRVKIVPGSSIYVPKKEFVSKDIELEEFTK